MTYVIETKAETIIIKHLLRTTEMKILSYIIGILRDRIRLQNIGHRHYIR